MNEEAIHAACKEAIKKYPSDCKEREKIKLYKRELEKRFPKLKENLTKG